MVDPFLSMYKALAYSPSIHSHAYTRTRVHMHIHICTHSSVPSHTWRVELDLNSGGLLRSTLRAVLYLAVLSHRASPRPLTLCRGRLRSTELTQFHSILIQHSCSAFVESLLCSRNSGDGFKVFPPFFSLQ